MITDERKSREYILTLIIAQSLHVYILLIPVCPSDSPLNSSVYYQTKLNWNPIAIQMWHFVAGRMLYAALPDHYTTEVHIINIYNRMISNLHARRLS